MTNWFWKHRRMNWMRSGPWSNTRWKAYAICWCRWSPDGTKLAFLSSRPGAGEPAGNQIWLLPMSGGEALQLTHIKTNVASFQWSPDGKRFLLNSRTGPTDSVPPDKKPSDVRHYK